jgi:eukaryotic-like serine/threonine-protein kinase
MGTSPRPSSPSTPDRFTFESEGFRYEVRRPLLRHEDHGTLLLARCRSLVHDAPRHAVVLKRMAMSPGRQARARAVEEVRLAEYLHHSNIARVLRLAEYQGSPMWW